MTENDNKIFNRGEKTYTRSELLWAYRSIVEKKPSERLLDSLPDYCNLEDFKLYLDCFKIERKQLDDQAERLDD